MRVVGDYSCDLSTLLLWAWCNTSLVTDHCRSYTSHTATLYTRPCWHRQIILWFRVKAFFAICFVDIKMSTLFQNMFQKVKIITKFCIGKSIRNKRETPLIGQIWTFGNGIVVIFGTFLFRFHFNVLWVFYVCGSLTHDLIVMEERVKSSEVIEI